MSFLLKHKTTGEKVLVDDRSGHDDYALVVEDPRPVSEIGEHEQYDPKERKFKVSAEKAKQAQRARDPETLLSRIEALEAEVAALKAK